MPEIQYPTNPNSDTAFVVLDGGKKNRALMVAPQDTSTLELSDNPNSTKGYVTIDGQKHRVNLVADITGSGGGGGGTVDYSKTVQKSDTIPTASASNAGQVYLYTGATNANYTQNYIYKNVKTATYTGTVSFEAATISGLTVTCSGNDFANFLTESGVEPLSVVSGTMTYDSVGALWRLVGKDSNNETVLTFQEYQQDFENNGFTFSGTPSDGDVIAFTCTVEEASATYAWMRIDVQPAPSGLPDQTGNAGKFLTTDGTGASWSDKPLVNTTTKTQYSIVTGGATGARDGRDIVIGENTTGGIYTGGGVLIGHNLNGGNYFNGVAIISQGQFNILRPTLGGAAVMIGNSRISYTSNSAGGVIIADSGAITGGAFGIILGGENNIVSASNAIQIGGRSQTNSDANTFKVGNANGNFEIMSADGTVPHGRLTNAVVPNAITIAVADWNGGTTCTKTISGLTATSVVWVAPDNASQSGYLDSGVYASAQATDSITFTATTTPTSALTVNVIYC